MGLILCVCFEAALQLGPNPTRKIIDLALCVCQLGLGMRDRNECAFETLEGGQKRQNGKFGECGLSCEGGRARRGTWSSGLPVCGSGERWVHWHRVTSTVMPIEIREGCGNCDGRREESRMDAKTEGEHGGSDPCRLCGPVKGRRARRTLYRVESEARTARARVITIRCSGLCNVSLDRATPAIPCPARPHQS